MDAIKVNVSQRNAAMDLLRKDRELFVDCGKTPTSSRYKKRGQHGQLLQNTDKIFQKNWTVSLWITR